ncbi:recombinase family protein [Porcipelethomonas sp.]|uniref:recombinase family protein n=1 Tax=Porcipelethomonas sp. TaxID=2981675 RepID=UPI003EF0D56F
MPNTGIYCRLSIEDRNKLKDDDSQSIQNQKSMLQTYCKERDWDIYDIYCDDGYSGVDRCRPEFNRMLKDCECGKINIVLCKDQSRFSRDTVIIEQYINDKFLEWGVRFIGVADNADSDSESYGTMRLFTSAYNEMYVKDISSKIRKTLAYKREQGQFIGSFAPYGYMIDSNDKHHLVIDENTAPVVRMIFGMYIQGTSYRNIVKELNSRKILSPSAYKRKTGSGYVNCNAESSNSRGLWTQSTVASILRNEMYTGTLVQGKSHNISYKNKKKKKVPPENWIKIPGSHEAIIDNHTWKAAQDRIQSRVRASSAKQMISPLSGKVKCAVCGKPMKRNVYYNKAKTIQYYGLQCASCKTGAMNCTNEKSISGKELEKIIIDELNKIISEYCNKDKIKLIDIYSEQTDAMKHQIEVLKKQHQTAKSRLIKTYKDKLDGLISAEDFKVFRENLSDEEIQLSGRIKELTNKLESSQLNQNAEDKYSVIEKYTHFSELTRTVTEEFIDHVEVSKVQDNGEREIHIHWNI